MSNKPEMEGKNQAEKKKPSFGMFVLKAILTPIVIAICVAGYFIINLNSFGGSPLSKTADEVEFIIWPGTSFDKIAKDLEERGLIKDVRKFKMLAIWTDYTTKMRSGRYTINTKWTHRQLLEQLSVVMPALDRITIPEGLPWWEVAKRMEEANLIKFDDFKTVIHNPEFLRKYGIPLDSAEGYLFPDTYLFVRPLDYSPKSAEDILGHMIDTFWKRTITLWSGDGRSSPNVRAQVARIITIASIVEKEAGVLSERPNVSGVFHNRIDKKMPLQADPTIIYGLGPSFDGNIRRKDIDDKSNPYNTYQIPGLPPGPICSPSLSSLRAALSPTRHNYLYFVAKGDGTHEFTTNLKDHNRAVQMFILNK